MSSTRPSGSSGLGPSPRVTVWAWALYDWANSAYSTILITVVMLYISQVVLVPRFDGDVWGKTVYAWCISVSMVLAAVLSPMLGAMADVNRSKRRWLALTALGGAGVALIMAAVPPSWPWAVVALLVLTSLCFELSLGFYNAFLPEITDEHSVNRVSALGFALGYIGGAIPLVLALGVVSFGPRLGLHTAEGQLRTGIAIMALWWGVFSLPTLLVLRDRGPPPVRRQRLRTAAANAAREVAATLRNIRRYRYLALFLVGFLFYNEGVQTVISQASVFGEHELHLDKKELITLVLMVQFLALPGAILVGWLSDHLGQKTTLLGCLAVWVALLVAALVIRSKVQFWVMGGIVAMVMGGTQSVSRAIMGTMTPEPRTGEFFGFFNFSGKATSFLGPNLFGWVLLLTGSARAAVFSLVGFFVLGGAIAARVDVARGRQQALATEATSPQP